MKEIQLEYLDRGLVAASTSEGVFLSWRLLGDEATGYNDKGLTGTDFNVYRDGKKIATVTDSTNYVDATGKSTSRYEVAAVNKKGQGEQTQCIRQTLGQWVCGHSTAKTRRWRDACRRSLYVFRQ